MQKLKFKRFIPKNQNHSNAGEKLTTKELETWKHEELHSRINMDVNYGGNGENDGEDLIKTQEENRRLNAEERMISDLKHLRRINTN